jgi:hypothetical protein
MSNSNLKVMSKKVIVLAGLCTLGPWASEAYAEKAETTPIYSKVSDLPGIYEEIVLKGDLMYGLGPNAIEAGANDDAVYIQFNQNFGSVNIAILNGNGVQVYGTAVDTSIQQVVIIPFTTAAADTYTVVLNKADNYAEGDFDKN